MMLRLLLTSSSTLPSAPLHNRGWHISASAVDLQRDCGRGQEHLSARLEEGDVCVYQVGTWMVDNVPVGPGDPPRLLLARVDCLQINWTTDCEHGRILATAVSTLTHSHPSETPPTWGAKRKNRRRRAARERRYTAS